MKKRVVILSCALTLTLTGWSQKVLKLIQKGNDHYQQQQYDEAAGQYNKALEADPGNVTAKFNLGNTLYKQEKPGEAAKLFTTVATDATEAELRSKAHYNNGVILTKQKKLEESIEAYKNALRQNADDQEARENLQKALLELKKKNPPKKKDEKQNKKKQDQKQQQKQQQPKMSPKEAEQRLKLLEQKEKEVQQRLQKAKTGAGQAKDW